MARALDEMVTRHEARASATSIMPEIYRGAIYSIPPFLIWVLGRSLESTNFQLFLASSGAVVFVTSTYIFGRFFRAKFFTGFKE